MHLFAKYIMDSSQDSWQVFLILRYEFYLGGERRGEKMKYHICIKEVWWEGCCQQPIEIIAIYWRKWFSQSSKYVFSVKHPLSGKDRRLEIMSPQNHSSLWNGLYHRQEEFWTFLVVFFTSHNWMLHTASFILRSLRDMYALQKQCVLPTSFSSTLNPCEPLLIANSLLVSFSSCMVIHYAVVIVEENCSCQNWAILSILHCSDPFALQRCLERMRISWMCYF